MRAMFAIIRGSSRRRQGVGRVARSGMATTLVPRKTGLKGRVSQSCLAVLAKAGGGRHSRRMIGNAEIAQFPGLNDTVAFHRTELSVILQLYGRMVAAGLWRDYGISMLREVAVFAVFRHTAEHPIYRIEKRPRLAGRQGQYSVVAMDGRILKRGSDLAQVLRVLEKKLIRAV
jgi:hypothetical protein